MIAGALAYWLTLLAEIAPANFPFVPVTPLNSVALYPFPEESAAAVPVPSSKAQRAARPGRLIETVKLVEPLTDPRVARIVVLPGETAVTKPVLPLMTAIGGVEEDQTTDPVRFCVLASL